MPRKSEAEVLFAGLILAAAIVGAVPGFPLGLALMMLAVLAAFTLGAILVLQALRLGSVIWIRLLAGLASIAFGVWYALTFIGDERLGRLAGIFTGTE
ncbi:MAG TPA: hypothetical protein VHO23_02640 [Candidatus Paceibacterota bacterium]|nr:hypothetical protein [Candidatus Paceibacterota bacterium]